MLPSNIPSSGQKQEEAEHPIDGEQVCEKTGSTLACVFSRTEEPRISATFLEKIISVPKATPLGRVFSYMPESASVLCGRDTFAHPNGDDK